RGLLPSAYNDFESASACPRRFSLAPAGHLAQWLEHLAYTEGVGGSKPSVPNRRKPRRTREKAYLSALDSAARKPRSLRKSSAGGGFYRMSTDRVPSYRKHKQSGQAIVT